MSNGSPRQAPSAVQRHTLPRQSTPFVGRTEELAGIVALLADPACRLLTLLAGQLAADPPAPDSVDERE